MTVEITRLSNGIHVLTHAMPQLETAAIGIWVRAGSRDERRRKTASRIFSSTWRSRVLHGARRARLPRRSKQRAVT